MADAEPDVSEKTTTIPPSQAAPSAVANTTPLPAPRAVPLTSLEENGLGKRPRDARLIHMLLASLGCTAYQERVPLQLLDFAYRHSSSILSDALHLSSDAYVSQQTRARDAPPGGGFREADGQVSANAVMLAIQSRLQYQFGGSGAAGGAGGLSKEFLLEVAQQRNKVALPRVLQNEWGVRLPSERFVLTGVPWGLKGEWVEEDDTQEDGMEGVEMEQNGFGEGEEGGTMEDLFGGDEDMDKDE
ncbi:TFIID-31kDa-domain-containing protein [Hyaloscypha variabilis F]|uniref:TFIID-31kDa-domain-containing protein n=1 Tax=Hyaloscypha variabilis (strain UAMH 11265 / GT02V1 / F) TaxID=1149755 RepID=A0A2J6RHM8_HYAVF|nr:TFIID-31kDa-domain-containing protein [Hyaloscypha variabilis F]